MSPDSGELSETLEWLYGTQWFGVKLGLSGMERLAQAGGLDVGESIRFLHVAGTNGKGSTCAMLDSVCRAAGLRTGLYTSPHLVALNERFQFNGEPVTDLELAEGLARIRARVSGWDPHPTFFEITTAFALEWFQNKGAEVVVFETGLGGRLDATNIVKPAVSVLTSIGLDHQQYLGSTLFEIAGEKAGIIKPGVPCVSAPQEPEVLSVLKTRAGTGGSALTVVDAPWTKSEIGLSGNVQRWNASLAERALQASGLRISEDACFRGLAEVSWPGRFQCVASDLVLDGAHNPHAAAHLIQTWREVFGDQRACLVFGALEDKDVRRFLEVLAPIVAEVVLVPVDNPRALSTAAMALLVHEQMPGVPVRMASSMGEALCLPSVYRRLLTGSLYLVGEALAHLRGQKPRRTSQ